MTAYAYQPVDPTRVMGRRIGAYVIDSLIAAGIAAAILVPMFSSRAQEVPRSSPRAQVECKDTSGSTGGTSFTANRNLGTFCYLSNDKAYIVSNGDFSTLQGAGSAIFIGFIILNAVLLQGLTGATIGKLIFGLRTVRLDGSKVGIGRAALRSVLLVVIDAPCCWLVGLITSLTTQGHRRLGDMAASTVVVRASQAGQPLAIPGLTGPAATVPPGYAPAPPAGWTAPPAGEGWGAAQGWGVTPPPVAPPPSGDGPVWDEARHTYIQYDRNRGAWLQWSDERREWGPIDT